MFDLTPLNNGKNISQEAWITTGALKDRLGMDALAISASTNPICIAVKEMMYDRQYVDLTADVTHALFNMLIAANEPATNAAFPGSGPMTLSKKAAILDPTNIRDIERP